MKITKIFVANNDGYETVFPDGQRIWICKESVRPVIGYNAKSISVTLSDKKISNSFLLKVNRGKGINPMTRISNKAYDWILQYISFTYNYVDFSLSIWLSKYIEPGEYYLSVIDNTYGLKPNGQKYWNVRRNGRFSKVTQDMC